MPKVLYPLEGDAVEEVRFKVYDNVGRELWGEARVRREKNPDVLVLELRQMGPNPKWNRLMAFTAHEGQLLVSTHGIHGGANDSSTRPH